MKWHLIRRAAAHLTLRSWSSGEQPGSQVSVGKALMCPRLGISKMCSVWSQVWPSPQKMPLSLGWEVLLHINTLPWGFWVDLVWLSTQSSTTCGFQEIRESQNNGLAYFQPSEISFLDRNRHYGTELAHTTAQMLRASEKHHKIPDMSLQHSVAGTEHTQMKEARKESKSQQRVNNRAGSHLQGNQVPPSIVGSETPAEWEVQWVWWPVQTKPIWHQTPAPCILRSDESYQWWEIQFKNLEKQKCFNSLGNMCIVY